MKLKVYDLNGNVVEEIDKPSFLNVPVREDIIKRAVLSEESYMYQPKGNYHLAGMQTSAEYVGRKEAYKSLKNRGQAMLPREFYGGGIPGRVRRIPSAVGGRRAHPPKPEKKIVEYINRKEWLKAMQSALAACFDVNYVIKRGHKVEEAPFVITDDVLSINKTKDIFSLFKTLFGKDLIRAKEGKKRRTGVRRRKGGKIYPKSALVVVDKSFKAAENIPGVDVRIVEDLSVRDLAPGTHPGRLLVITKSALKKLSSFWGEVE